MKHQQWKYFHPKFETDAINPGFRSSPWAGHRRFVYDLIANLQPALTVELGTHYGVSLFAMAQSLKDHGMTCRLVGIDTWEGDEHAGFYNNEVFESFEDIRSNVYASVNSEALRMRFEEAVDLFEDGSIDLLHIDGLHTYQSTKQDFETWLPKISDRGIILFHDVSEATGYGTSLFWSEIRGTAPNVTFPHSFGLGVFFPNGVPLGCEEIIEGSSNLPEWYEVRSRLDLAEIQVVDQAAMIDDRDAAISAMTAMIDDRDAAISAMTAMIDDRDTAISAMTAMIDDRDTAISAMTAIIDET
jgi:predicted O-methyltransferase YrrM